MGFFKALVKAPWWLLAFIAVAVAFFGNVFPDYSYAASGLELSLPQPDLLGMVERFAPEIAPSLAWLDSMGFDRNAPLGGSSSSSIGFGGQQESWFYDRAPAIATAFACGAAMRFIFAGPKQRAGRSSPDFLNSASTVNAVLRGSTVKISDEAWNDPLNAPAMADPTQVQPAQPLRTSGAQNKRVQAAMSNKPMRTGGMFGSRAPKTDQSRAVQEAMRAKLEQDPFEKLARQEQSMPRRVRPQARAAG